MNGWSRVSGEMEEIPNVGLEKMMFVGVGGGGREKGKGVISSQDMV